MLSDLRYRLRALLRRRAVERDLDAELRFHIEQQTDKYRNDGLSSADAGRRALVVFGRVESVKDECRDVRGLGALEAAWRDLRYAVRGLGRAPAFTITVILTVALGIGVNTAAFTIFNAYLLKRAPVDEPDSLYEITWITRDGRGHRFTWQEYEDFQQRTAVFSGAFATRKVFTRISGRLAFGQLVTRDYFQIVGVDAARGRVLSRLDGTSENEVPPLAVLSHTGWTALFGADPAIVGKDVRIGGARFQVIGIAPAGFTGLGEQPFDFWAPLSAGASLIDGPALFAAPSPGSLEIAGRLRPDVSERAAQSALTLWAAQLTASLDDDHKATQALLTSQATRVPLPYHMLVVVVPIAAAFGLVLLIASANVTNLMLARAMSRHREFGVRLSLGAARARLVQQLMIESLVLALPAAAAGLAVAYGTIHLAIRLLFATMPPTVADLARHIAALEPDYRVYAFTIAAAVSSALVFGLAPALQATRIDVARLFAGELVAALRPARLRSALVVLQVTAAVVLMICAALLLRGAVTFARVDPGVDARGVLAIEVRGNARARALEALAASPLVQRIAATSAPIPFDGMPPMVSAIRVGGQELFRASCYSVSPEYFGVLDVPLRAGRTFSAEEARSGAPVAIVSETAARLLWPGGGAIGQLLRLPVSEQRATKPAHEIVQIIAIAGDTVTGYSSSEAARTTIYLPTSARDPRTALLVRVGGDVDAAFARLDAELSQVDTAAVTRMHKLEEFAIFRAYPFRVVYWIAGTLGGLALLLTLSGIYGVLSFVVAQRSREIGIRMALGETAGGAAGLVLSQSLRLSLLGVAIGTLVSLAASGVLASQLVTMQAFDPAAYGGAILLVVVCCAVTSYFPALRAARIDPFATLRRD
jgi:putative ABC transport system permease protein